MTVNISWRWNFNDESSYFGVSIKSRAAGFFDNERYGENQPNECALEFYAAPDGQADELHRALLRRTDYSLAEIAEEFGVVVKRSMTILNVQKRFWKITKWNSICIPITHSQIFWSDLERYPKILFYKSRLKFYHIDNREWLWQSVIYQVNTFQKLLVAEEVFLLDYRLFAQWYLQSYANRFSC